MSIEKDRKFFINFSLIVVVLAIMMGVFMYYGYKIGSEEAAVVPVKTKSTEAQVAAGAPPVTSGTEERERVPVDEDLAAAEEPIPAPVADAPATTEAGSASKGKEIYDSTCVTCHGSGIPGIPQMGNKEEWASRLSQGTEVLYDHAVNGYTGAGGMPMPAKGGNTKLSDDDVKAAVDYIVANSQ